MKTDASIDAAVRYIKLTVEHLVLFADALGVAPATLLGHTHHPARKPCEAALVAAYRSGGYLALAAHCIEQAQKAGES